MIFLLVVLGDRWLLFGGFKKHTGLALRVWSRVCTKYMKGPSSNSTTKLTVLLNIFKKNIWTGECQWKTGFTYEGWSTQILVG